MQRSFSFQQHDDDPSSHPLVSPLDHHPQHRSPPPPPPPFHQYQQQEQPQQQQQQQQQHYPSPQQQQQQHYPSPQQHGYYDPPPHQTAHMDLYYSQQPPPQRRDSAGSAISADSFTDRPNRNSGTVVRKPVPPASAAAAAATLETVRNDLRSPSPQPPQAPYNSGNAYASPPVPRHFIPPTAPAEDARYWGRELGYSRSAASTPTLVPTPQSSSSYPPRPPRHSVGYTPTGSAERVYIDPVAGHYTDNPYKRTSTTWDPMLAASQIDSSALLSDDAEDDDLYRKKHARGGVGAGAAAAATGAAMLRGGATSANGVDAVPAESGGLLRRAAPPEKNAFMAEEEKRTKRKRWIVGIMLLVLVLAIAGGTAAGVIISKNNSGGGSGKAGKAGEANGGGNINLDAAADTALNGDLGKDSPEIKALMDNSKLHKVFHGIDYTPLNGVYPECLKWKPSQNNITRDIAVMSKLTNKIRLYGNDCNQTQMVLHAIDRLEVDMKIWVGVWLDGNSTTNTRQINQLHEILNDTAHHDKIDGVAVGNEVLFSKFLTEIELFNYVDEVRADLKAKGMNIPVGTSDLGSNWNSNMASKVDVLMANVHPFFAGVKVEDAADWTYKFFEENDVSTTVGLTKKPRVMISEVGWPSAGGSTKASVAGISQLNRFMKDFVCQENARGTEYYWFSAFDEPWKIRYNQPALGKEWEDKWGLMDVNRNLKPGLEIPTCA